MKTINHEAFVNLYNKRPIVFKEVFDKSQTLKQLMSKIGDASMIFQELGYPDSEKVKGDLFEIFAELFFKVLAADNRIGVFDYKTAPSDEDYGVDGFGIGMDEKPLTVQVKFRSNQEHELTSDELKQFAFQSFIRYDVDKTTQTNLIIFTSAKGLHWVTDSKVFSGRLRCIGFDQIRKLVDNNTIFWKECQLMIGDTINCRYTTSTFR